MRRRTFLSGVSLAAAGVPPTSPVQARTRAVPLGHWTWSCAAGPLEVIAQTTGVSVYAGPANLTEDAGDPMAIVGADRQPVMWGRATWQEPDADHRRLLLNARDGKLLAEISLSHDPATGLIAQHTVLTHRGEGETDIHATRAFSFSISEPIDRILYLTGGWAEESEVQRAHLDDGVLTMESRAGKTGFQFQPYVALSSDSQTWLCQILWSGNWMLQIEPVKNGVLLSGGLSNWRFRHRLRAGERLELPTVLFGPFSGGLNAATQRLHDYRRVRRPDPERPIPVQFNSWYPYLGEPTAEALIPLVPLVKQLGCEAFVVDAGWYRTDEGESNAEWMQRTGDWRTSRRRFPNGLREVSSACHEHGLKFGLWFEPEVISSSSTIRREHPEWLHHIDGRETPADERAILNLGVPAAWRHVHDRLVRMLGLIGVDWMKWDFNADLGSGGWAPGLPAQLTRQDPLIAHYKALYRLQDAIRSAFPNIILEMCAGGGGRMDGAILSHAHVNWMSDQAGAVRKLSTHFGTQLAHPAVACNDWLIDWPGGDPGQTEPTELVDWRGDLAFRLQVAMLGTFGISAPIDRWSAADIATATEHVGLYRAKVRPLIHHGDQHYLTPAPRPDGSSDWAAMWYAAKDGLSGVLFAFRLAGAEAARRFALPGLKLEQTYRLAFMSGPTLTISGADLAQGIEVRLDENYRSALCLVEATG